jgi:hypothetical protein
MAERRNQLPDIDGAALAELPIFPLPDVVLFPSELLPLHVFEERYRDMTRDALDGHGVIAMTRLRPEAVHSDSEQPEVYPIAGLGKIEAARETPDGRYLVLLRGIGRVAIREELPLDRSYRRVRAALVPDVPSERPELVSACSQQLMYLCDRLAEAYEEASDLRDVLRAAETPGERADVVSAAVVSDPDERQRLLETLDPADRLDRLLELVAEAMTSLGVERQLN